jgi:hypothetical protein
MPIIFLEKILVLARCGNVGGNFNGYKAENIANGITTQTEI